MNLSLQLRMLYFFPLSDVDAERLLTVKTLIEYIEEKLHGKSDLFQDMIPVEYKDPNPQN